MRKILVSALALFLSLHALANPTFATKNVSAKRSGQVNGKLSSTFCEDSFSASHISVTDFLQFSPADTTARVSKKAEGKMATITAQGIYTGGDVTLSVTQTDADTYSLHDSKRNIYVVSGAEFKPLDSLAMQGRFYDYFAKDDRYGDDVDLYINELVTGDAESDERINVSNYLKTVGTVSSKDAFHEYRLKSITVSSFTDDGKDFMPSASAPLTVLRMTINHGKNRWSTLFEHNAQGLTDSPIVMSSDELYDRWRVIPAEGAIFSLYAIRADEDADPESDDFFETAERASVNIYFVPNESGITEIDQDGLKATITYERSASPNVDIYRNLSRTYDFYKNVFGRESYDGQGSPIYCMTYLPGGEMGFASIDETEPKYLFFTEQVGAYAKYIYDPAVIICGTGGRLTDPLNPEKGNYILPMVEPSILCHEFTHLVTKCTSRLSSNLYKEGGALNESFSDIMAISMMKTADYGNGPETPWVIGGNGLVLGKSCLRNMANPKQGLDGEDNQPDTYEGLYWNERDKYNMMGVQNKFYYLLCEGGKGTNDKGTDYDMTGIGIEKGMQIAYLTLTKYCSPESDYSNIRDSWLKAAQELYGENGAEAEAVANAWTAVGINGSVPTGIDTFYAGSTQGSHSSAWFTIDGRRLDAQPTQKGVYIYHGKKIVR
jgi:hypothetical protein